MPRSVAIGVALTVVSAFAFGSGALFAKPVYAAGVGWHVLMAWRFLIGAIFAWGWVALSPGARRGLRRMGRRLEGRRAWGALGLALAGVALAVGNIDVAEEAPPVPGLILMVASPIIYSVWIVLAARLSGEGRAEVGRDAEAGADPTAAGAGMLTATATALWLSALALGRPVLPAE